CRPPGGRRPAAVRRSALRADEQALEAPADLHPLVAVRVVDLLAHVAGQQQPVLAAVPPPAPAWGEVGVRDPPPRGAGRWGRPRCATRWPTVRNQSSRRTCGRRTPHAASPCLGRRTAAACSSNPR